MATHAILFGSDRASNAWPNESCLKGGYGRLFFDLAASVCSSTGWLTRLWSQLVALMGNVLLFPNGEPAREKKIARFHGFNEGLSKCARYFSRTLAECYARETERKAPLVNSHDGGGHTKLR